MLRRKLTRIQLCRDDIEEYDAIKRQNLAKSRREHQTSNSNAINELKKTQSERVAEVHRRIGYQPETVPADGTQRLV